MNVARRPFGADLLLGTMRLLSRALFRVSVHGNVAEFDNERTLIVANHESFLDGLLLGVFLPVEATFVVHTQIANNRILPLDSAFHTAPGRRLDQPSRDQGHLQAGGDRQAGHHLSRRPSDGHRLADEGLRRCGVHRRQDGGGRGAHPHRWCRPQFLRPAGGSLSAESLSEDHHYHHAAASYRNAAAPIGEAETASSRRAHAAHPARHAGRDAAGTHLVRGVLWTPKAPSVRATSWSKTYACRKNPTVRCCACRLAWGASWLPGLSPAKSSASSCRTPPPPWGCCSDSRSPGACRHCSITPRGRRG